MSNGGGLNIEAIKNIVEDRFTTSETFAAEQMNRVEEFLDVLEDLWWGEKMPENIDLNYPTTDIRLNYDAFGLRPTDIPDLTPQTFTTPSDPSLVDIETPTLPDLPDIGNHVDDITLDLPNKPSSTMPDEITEDVSLINEADLGIPNKADYGLPPTLPAVPELEKIIPVSIPEIEDLGLPAWEGDGDKPVLDFDPPDEMFVYYEDIYSSSLSNAIKSKLLTDLQNGGRGLDETWETALYERTRERRRLEDERMYEEAEKYFSSRGWMIPPGALASRLAEVSEIITGKNDELNETILMKQLDMARETEKFTIEKIISWETQMMVHANSVANRAFEAAKATVQTAIDIYNAKITQYNAQLQTWRTVAEVFKTRVEAAAKKLDVYRLKLEGQKLQNDIQLQELEKYKAELSGLTILANLYSAEMEGAKLRLEIDNHKLARFRYLVDNYVAQVGAKTSQFNLYQAQLTGEETKVRLYKEQVGAFGERLNVDRLKNDIEMATINSQIATNQNELAKFAGEVERFKTQLTAENDKIRNEVEAYGHKRGVYETDVRVQEMDINAQLAEYNKQVEEQEKRVKILVEEANYNLKNFTDLHGLEIETAKAGANVAAQLIASSLSSMAVGARMDYDGRESIYRDETVNLDGRHLHQHTYTEK